MRKIILAIVSGLLLASSLMAQTKADEFRNRYALLVGKLGPAGVGIETLLNKWESEFPDDVDMLCAKYNYYLYKSQTSQVVKKDQAKFMGNEPVLSLKDSTGNDVHYFTEQFFDDEYYGMATKAIDQAIRISENDIALRFNKINSLIAYEKESPDMATQSLLGLIDYNCSSKPEWTYGKEPFVQEDFAAYMLEYCLAFFQIGSSVSYESMKSISEKMLHYYPGNTDFINNLGTYYLVCKKDHKAALKSYNKTLKLDPDNIPAIKNCILISRRDKNVKLEKKYLQMLAKYSEDELESASAKTRLSTLK